MVSPAKGAVTTMTGPGSGSSARAGVGCRQIVTSPVAHGSMIFKFIPALAQYPVPPVGGPVLSYRHWHHLTRTHPDAGEVEPGGIARATCRKSGPP